MRFVFAVAALLISAPAFATAEYGYFDCHFKVKDSRPVPQNTKREYISHPGIAPSEGQVWFGLKHTVEGFDLGIVSHQSDTTEEYDDVGWDFTGIRPLSPSGIRAFLHAPSDYLQRPSKLSYLRFSDRQLLRVQAHRPIKSDFLVQAHFNPWGFSTLTVLRQFNWIEQDDDIELGIEQKSVASEKIELTQDKLGQEFESLGMTVLCTYTHQD